MSEKKEKTTAEVTKKENKEAPAKKKENPLKKVGAKIKKFFKDFKGEWKKVTWPSGKTVLNHSIVVIVIVAIVGVAVLGVDTGLSAIIDALVSLASK
ncbi:MAG: preprotein translocase subunit SecE [Clostridia bacterium]|nr:preprotein translocase subunit SecE [Clostridia bacterium]